MEEKKGGEFYNSYEYHKEYIKKYLSKFDTVRVRLTSDEHEQLKWMAEKAGKSVNQYVKDLIFGKGDKK